MKTNTTKLWRITPQKRRILMATVTPGSRYTSASYHVGKNYMRKKDREDTAQRIRDGWRHNGSFEPGTMWEVE